MIAIFLIIISLIALVYLIIGFFELIELFDDAATGENSLNQKRFFKKLLIISLIIGAGILFEYEYLNEFGIFFQILGANLAPKWRQVGHPKRIVIKFN